MKPKFGDLSDPSFAVRAHLGSSEGFYWLRKSAFNYLEKKYDQKFMPIVRVDSGRYSQIMNFSGKNTFTVSLGIVELEELFRHHLIPLEEVYFETFGGLKFKIIEVSQHMFRSITYHKDHRGPLTFGPYLRGMVMGMVMAYWWRGERHEA